MPKNGLIISAILILIATVFVFVGFELQHNQELYIQNYTQAQQKLSDQVALRLQEYLEAEQLTTQEAIDKVSAEVDTTGSRYWYIAAGDSLLFVKNKNTSELFTNISFSTFLQERLKDGMKISRSSLTDGDVVYTIGICSSKEYISDSGEIFKHKIYILMPMILMACVLLAVPIIGFLTISRQDIRIKQLTAEAVERNITIEQLTERIKKGRINDVSSRGQFTGVPDKQVYNKEVLTSLLEKINRENVVPLTIIITEFCADRKTDIGEDYQRCIKNASGLIHKEHVLAEIMPEVFAILLFQSDSEYIEEIKKTLVHKWAIPLKKKGIKIRMGITCITDHDTDVENIFAVVYREVAGMRAEGSLRLSS